MFFSNIVFCCSVCCQCVGEKLRSVDLHDTTSPHNTKNIIKVYIISANGKLVVWVGGLDSWDSPMKGIVT